MAFLKLSMAFSFLFNLIYIIPKLKYNCGVFGFSCINFSIGYYDYHSKNEYVVVEDVYNGIETGKKMIENLGYKKYPFTSKPKYIF